MYDDAKWNVGGNVTKSEKMASFFPLLQIDSAIWMMYSCTSANYINGYACPGACMADHNRTEKVGDIWQHSSWES